MSFLRESLRFRSYQSINRRNLSFCPHFINNSWLDISWECHEFLTLRMKNVKTDNYRRKLAYRSLHNNCNYTLAFETLVYFACFHAISNPYTVIQTITIKCLEWLLQLQKITNQLAKFFQPWTILQQRRKAKKLNAYKLCRGKKIPKAQF